MQIKDPVHQLDKIGMGLGAIVVAKKRPAGDLEAYRIEALSAGGRSASR